MSEWWCTHGLGLERPEIVLQRLVGRYRRSTRRAGRHLVVHLASLGQPGRQESLTLCLAHHPRDLHTDLHAALEATLLTTLARRHVDDAVLRPVCTGQ